MANYVVVLFLLLLKSTTIAFLPTSSFRWLKSSTLTHCDHNSRSLSTRFTQISVLPKSIDLSVADKWRIDPKLRTLIPAGQIELSNQDLYSKIVLIKHLGNLTHADLLQILLVECGGVDESDVQYSTDFFSGSPFAMVHYSTKQDAERAVSALRRYDWKFPQRVSHFSPSNAKYLDVPFVAEHNLYIRNISNSDEKQFEEVVTEILGHKLVAFQLFRGVKGGGKGRGAYIVLHSAEEANTALAKLSGRLCMGDAMVVTRVEPPLPRVQRLSVIDNGHEWLSSRATSAGGGDILQNNQDDLVKDASSTVELTVDSRTYLKEWLWSNRTVKISTLGNMLGDSKVSRNGSFVAARLHDICHIVVGVNTVTNINVTEVQEGGVAYIQFVDEKTTETALRTLPQWFQTKKIKASVHMTDLMAFDSENLIVKNPLQDKIKVYFRNIPARISRHDLGKLVANADVTYKEIGFGCITRNSINSYGEVVLTSVEDAVTCLKALQGQLIGGKEVKMELSALFKDRFEVSSSSRRSVAEDASWLSSPGTLLIRGLPTDDPNEVYDHCHMALGVNTLTNINVSRSSDNVTTAYLQIKDHRQLHEAVVDLRKRFTQNNIKANVSGSDIDASKVKHCTAVNPFRDFYLVFVRNLSSTVTKQELQDLCSIPCTVKFGCHKKKSDWYFAQLKFYSLQDALFAVQRMNGTSLQGKEVVAEVAGLCVGGRAQRVQVPLTARSDRGSATNGTQPADTKEEGPVWSWLGLSQTAPKSEVKPPETRPSDLHHDDNRTVVLSNVPRHETKQVIAQMRKAGLRFGKIQIEVPTQGAVKIYIAVKDHAHAMKIVVYWQSIPDSGIQANHVASVKAVVHPTKAAGNFTREQCGVFVKDLDPKMTKEQLIAVCSEALPSHRVTSVHLLGRAGSEKGDSALLFFSSPDAAEQAQVLLHGRTVNNRKIVVRMMDPVGDRDSFMFRLQNLHPLTTIYSLWTSIEKYLGEGSVKDIRIYVKKNGEVSAATVIVGSEDIADQAIAQLGRVRYKGLRLAPERCATKDSIVILKPIDEKATQMEVLRMVKYLVGSDSVEHLSLEKDNTGVICAYIVFRSTDATTRSLKNLQGRTLHGKPLVVEHVVMTKKGRTSPTEERVPTPGGGLLSLVGNMWNRLRGLF